MSEVTRRRFLAAGAAAGAGIVPGGWTAIARSGSAAPPEVLAANDLALWYDKPTGADWLRALPIGNGRLGAMVFGNVDTERLQLNEDTVWAAWSVRLRQHPRRGQHRGDPAAGLRGSVGACCRT